MNLIITGTSFSFPDGTGAAARVTAIAKGLRHHGATVHLFCLKPTETQSTDWREPQVAGVYDGIPFEYTCGQRVIAKTRVGAALLYLKGLWRACRTIRRIHRKTPIDAILLWHAESPINVLVFKTLAWSTGALLIAEECELPFVYYRKSTAIRVRVWLNEHFTYRFLDGIIVISTFLQDYFAARVSKTVKLLLVPILVEPGFFAPAAEMPERTERKIIYCGNLDHEGEVADLLRAFVLVASEFPQWRVEVIGPLPQGRAAEDLQKEIGRLNLAGRMAFTGAVARSEIPARLAAGDIMALLRRSGAFSTASLPTKLGEYLVTGKPVVVTNIGDISHYLQDGVNAFLPPPDDIAAFARALQHVILHPEEAREVGRRGREVAESQFNSHLHAERIIEFIRALRMAR
jgi:glycosyltransferase involved in cell wall biosynthesis